MSSFSIEGCRTTKIYCRPGCPPGRRMKAENRVVFSSREEARAAGYRPCKICKPDESVPHEETSYLTMQDTPFGPYTIVSSARGIVLVASEITVVRKLGRLKRSGLQVRECQKHYNSLLARELDEYFSGKLVRFTVPLDLRGTPFQIAVWKSLCGIPYGETRAYSDIACAVGRPLAARPVGRIIGENPVAIVVPCHRVIGKNGGLTGYGSGLERKAALLKMESRHGKNTLFA
jgi:O-6-methylguanine DNA methyltransferase